MPTILTLPLPCKLNALYTPIARGRYADMVKSKAGRIAEHLLVDSIHKQIGKPEPYTTDCYLNIRWRNGTKHRHDIDGIIKQLLDCLTKAGVIEDDCLIKSMTVELEQPMKPAQCTVEIGELQ